MDIVSTGQGGEERTKKGKDARRDEERERETRRGEAKEGEREGERGSRRWLPVEL